MTSARPLSNRAQIIIAICAIITLPFFIYNSLKTSPKEKNIKEDKKKEHPLTKKTENENLLHITNLKKTGSAIVFHEGNQSFDPDLNRLIITQLSLKSSSFSKKVNTKKWFNKVFEGNFIDFIQNDIDFIILARKTVTFNPIDSVKIKEDIIETSNFLFKAEGTLNIRIFEINKKTLLDEFNITISGSGNSKEKAENNLNLNLCHKLQLKLKQK